MSNVSNRVMSMKFMQKSSPSIENTEEKLQTHTSKDQSEWVLPQTSKLLRKKVPVVQTVGYSSINSFASFDDEDTPLPTRRVFDGEGTNLSKVQSGKSELGAKPEDESKKPQIDDLESLWKDNKPTKKSTKRKSDNETSKTKKRKAK